MHHHTPTRLLLAAAIMTAAAVAPMRAASPVAVHGSVQADVLFPETDDEIGTKEYHDKVLANIYADVSLLSKYVDAGVRFEYLQHPLPGYLDISPDFKGWGVPNIYVKGKYKGIELTAGDFYEQFGSGFILRTYEDRTLGIDNSLRGGRLKVNTVKGLRMTALGGVQRRFWDWSKQRQVYGANVELDLQEYIKALKDKEFNWMVGASYVLKHESGEDVMVPGTNKRLNLPQNVSAFDVRTQLNKSGFGLLVEYAWKGQDPSFQNGYTYSHGSALMVSATYSKKGLGALVQVKRSDNMDFRSKRSESEAALYINNLPPFNYQHTYTLAALYPYATQAAPGEWAFQGALSYKFNKGTAMGGKYGTKLSLNASYICGIERDEAERVDGTLMGTDWWKHGIGKLGQTYYTDINLQMEKRITRDFSLNAMYMYQQYNKTVVEGHGGMVHANIFTLDGKYKFSPKYQLRIEAQYLQTRDDDRDWVFGLAEFSLAPYLMLTVSDQWNSGRTGVHYYMASATGNYRNNRLMIGYGRTRAGYNCSGGVCRYVPATRGFQITYSYNF